VPTYIARDGQAPIVVSNNLAALEHQAGNYMEVCLFKKHFIDLCYLGNYATAESIYREIHEKCKKALEAEKAPEDTVSENDSQYTTITYNLARLEEDKGRLEEASALYEEILKRHPTYTDGEHIYASFHHDMMTYIWALFS
jgi:tetratricopeptide (TPR) repeat protein